MARVHVCSYIAPDGTSCPQLEPCPVHGRDRKRRRNGWAHRDGDRAKQMRDARAAKRRHRACQWCGSTEKLDYHHLPDGSGVVICNPCHVSVDKHARKR